MKPIRRMAWVALSIAYVHVVFGAIVRISGSGMGCGEHWPDCNGTYVPAVTNYTVAVEATHRFLAGMLLGITCGLMVFAWIRRSTPGVAGRGGVLRPAVLALALVMTAALVGMVVVKLSLASPMLIVVHYSIAMATLGALVVAVVRAGGFGVSVANVSPKTYRGAAAAVGLAFITVLFGALTANMPAASHVRLTHQVLAVLLFLHLLGLAIAVTKRRESPVIVRAAQLAFAIVLLQVVLGITLLALHLPPPLQSVHQAVGTLLWVTVFTFAALGGRANASGASRRPLPPTPSSETGRGNGFFVPSEREVEAPASSLASGPVGAASSRPAGVVAVAVAAKGPRDLSLDENAFSPPRGAGAQRPTLLPT